jgi:hypothetical protein
MLRKSEEHDKSGCSGPRLMDDDLCCLRIDLKIKALDVSLDGCVSKLSASSMCLLDCISDVGVGAELDACTSNHLASCKEQPRGRIVMAVLGHCLLSLIATE